MKIKAKVLKTIKLLKPKATAPTTIKPLKIKATAPTTIKLLIIRRKPQAAIIKNPKAVTTI